ncbi:hypothetical protein CGLO_17447 [Colletotrichum gloeosporioides Cg-14]|uniref:Uncharacterized protein n=1 Tax=Colletotrichum gloeosporioides (strain Cg-14) TaxID=1237896 RepID=T0KWV3_COLGC|nr:hypothetical protein CGLO_17447 [Colletotrichum gloeosporioides Cg-14]
MHDLSQKTSAKPAHATCDAHRRGWASATWLELAYGNDIAPLIDLYQAVNATPSLEVVSKSVEKIPRKTDFLRPVIHHL